MKFLSDIKTNLKGKRILLRVDFNVPIKNSKVTDDFRIKKTLPTINFLKRKGAKIILISHLTDGKNKSLEPAAKYLFKKIKGDITLLENIRNYPGEEKNDKNFAKQLAKLGDIYVNDAFSASHRNHASIVGIPKYLPSYAGLLFEEEYKNLSHAFKPMHPFLLILGGVKFGSKLGVLNRFLKTADRIFIGGALANNFFWANKMDIGKSVLDKNTNIKKFLRNPKIILPIDVKKKNGAILDIGLLATKELSLLVKKSKFILWNGPMGNFEEKKFSKGTSVIAKAIAKSKAQTIIGGGDTIAAIDKAKIPLNKFSFVSTAGGAMLEFLAKGTLPGIEALKSK
jgi:phosphoglycerate kinase